MIRSEVLKLYRDILRATKKIPDEYYRDEMARWARQDFKNNKHLSDEVCIDRQQKHHIVNRYDIIEDLSYTRGHFI